MTTFAKANVGNGATTLPQRWYVNDEVFRTEQQRIFAGGWVCIGRAERLEKPGDYFVADVASESLIVVRDESDAVHAFYNVCRHRGTRICETHSGRFSGAIQCPYHAWTYGLDGALRVARNMNEVPGFATSDYPLHEAALAQWEGFLFVNLANNVEPFDTTFAPLIGRFDAWNIGDLRTARTIEYDVACNWKLLFQNYSECYHCPLVHPQLEKLSASDSGRNDLVDGPFLGGYSELREEGMGLTMSGKTPRPPLGRIGGEDLRRDYYYTIFPTMLLSLHPDYVMVHYLRPITTTRTHVSCAWLFDPTTMARQDFDPSDAMEFWDLTNRQDWHVNELTQKGVLSKAYTPGPYANAEGLLAAFDRHYLRVMHA
jgi:Rieske 2Fe-2S family protein